MRYFATSFALTLGAWRLRIRVDLDDDPVDKPVVHHVAAGRPQSEHAVSR